MTEEEQQEWTESARAAIAELEQLNAEPEPTRQAAEAEGISSLQTPEPAELQEGCCTGQEAEEAPEVGARRSNRVIGTDRRGRSGGEGAVGVCFRTNR